MRNTLLALAVAAVGGFALASCGNSSNNTGDMGHDMGGGGTGGTMDMTVVKVNCLGVGYCVAMCPATEDAATCFNSCMKQAKPGSYQKWAAAFVCGQDFCAPDPDAGVANAACVRTSGPQGTFLCAPGQAYADCMMGTTMTSCTMCLDNAIAAPLIGDGTAPPTGMCVDATMPSCKGGTMCATQMNACINDP